VLLPEAAPDSPHFERLPDEIKLGFDTGTGVLPLWTPAGYPITLLAADAADSAAPLNLSHWGLEAVCNAGAISSHL
jgi:hypothetical protein